MTAAEGAVSSTPVMSFDTFVNANRRRLENALKLRWHNHKDIDDALQEAFMAASAQWHEVGVMQFPAAWVLKAALRKLSRWHERDVRQHRLIQEAGPNVGCLAPEPDPGDRLGERDRLKQALRSVPVSQADAVVIHDVLGFSIRETAEILGLPESTAKSHLYRGRRKLQQVLISPPSETVRVGGQA